MRAVLSVSSAQTKRNGQGLNMAFGVASITTTEGRLAVPTREQLVEAMEGLDEDLRHSLACCDYRTVSELAVAIDRLQSLLKRTK